MGPSAVTVKFRVVNHPAINAYLSKAIKLDYETRIERARLISDLLEHPGWKVFTEMLESSISPARHALEGWEPGVVPHEQITSRQGFLRGLVTASLIPEAVIEDGRRADLELQQKVAAMEKNA